MKSFLSAFLLLLFTCPPLLASQTVEYDWLTMGKKSGHQTVIYDGNKTLIDFEFTDRGRGPKTHDEIWLADDHTIIKQTVTGHSYMGAEVFESFSISNGVASWQSTDEKASVKVKGKAFYVSANGAPQSLEFLVKAVLAAPNQSLNLLPGGIATVEKLLTTTVSLDKQQKQVSLYAVNGMGFTPEYIWLDTDLRIFALAADWMGMVAKGWDRHLPQLQKLQDEANDKTHTDKAQKLTISLPGVTLIEQVNLFTATNHKLIKNTQVAIKAGKILAIGKAASAYKANRTINGRGKTLMPGLWDMHAHISQDDGLLNIAAGVTSIRDLANKHDTVMRLGKLFESGEAIGPSVYRAGFIDKKTQYSAPTGHLAQTLEEALAHIDWYAERGYPQIKIYSSIDPAWVKPMAERIHHHGMKLSGHIPSFMTTEQAINQGFDEIQHINMLFLNFLAGPKDDTRTPLRFTLVGDKAGQLDLDSKAVNDFIALLKAKDIVVDTTVTIFHSLFLNRAGQLDAGYAPIADHLPTNIRRSLMGATLDITAENEQAYTQSAAALLKMIKKLHDAGVRLVAGTDAMVGFTLHRELELFVEAGIGNAEVLTIATAKAAKIAGQSDVGTIEVGKKADLILLDGNPLNNISDIRKVALVIKGERAYQPAKLYQSVGVKPFARMDIEK